MNAEFLCDAKHHFAREWAILGWFVPVMWFWVPWHFVNNVLAASDPRVRARGDSIDGVRSPAVSLWWACCLLAGVTELAASGVRNRDDYVAGSAVVDQLWGAAAWSTASAVFCCAAGVVCVRLISTINQWQESRPVVPWWELSG